MSTDKSQSYGYHANGRTGFYMDLGKTNVSLVSSGTNLCNNAERPAQGAHLCIPTVQASITSGAAKNHTTLLGAYENFPN